MPWIVRSVGAGGTGSFASNRTLVRGFYGLAVVQHRPEAVADVSAGLVCHQRNPRVPDAPAPFVGYFTSVLSRHPMASSDIGRVLADGDLVAVHSHATTDRDDRGKAIVDIFRVSNGTIVEH